jgi:hypothetical protein
MRRAQAIVAQQSQEKGLDEELAASGEALALRRPCSMAL